MALARLILRASGYPIERDLRAHRLWEMVWDRLELLQKFLLHIDELQHVVQYITERERQEVANILKHGMHDRRISLIISGVDELKPFLDFDPQLLRRLTVKAFDPITPDSIGEVESMVKDYAAAAGLDLELEEKGVVRHDFHLRLAQSAMNAFGYAIVVTHLAIEVALHENSTTLTRNHFATMYAQKTNATADRNPFLASQWHTIDCKTLFQKTATYLPPAPASRKRAKCVS